MPDPAALTNVQWTELSKLLISLWIFVGSIIVFAASLLVAHVLIPSLVESGHLPERYLRFRTSLYTVGIVFFGGAMYLIARAAGLAEVIGTFYERWWI